VMLTENLKGFKMSKIQGEAFVYASPYTAFDPHQPEKTKAGDLSYTGVESEYLVSQGYVKVGKVASIAAQGEKT
ncbi:MAG: hypothetical protein ACTS5V_08435, partial [Giesbergeria sp.]